jgi:endonuclease/exonuclease/phosphatase family metal-dependent hydrolase
MPPAVKILQYNVLFAKDSQPTPWETRAAALRAWIALLDPDIITLQEITKGTRTDNGAAVNMLADILRGSALSHSVFGVAEDMDGQPGVVLGNAIACRWPISEQECRPLPQYIEEGVSMVSAASKRSAIWARIESPNGPLSVTCTHLNAHLNANAMAAKTGANRMDQMAAVLELVADHAQIANGQVGVMPSILCGDMNAVEQSDEIRYACGYHAHKGKSAPLALNDAWPSSAHISTPGAHEGHTSE